MGDTTDRIISEILAFKYENTTHCPFFILSDGRCLLKLKKYKPTVIFLSNSKGGKGSRFQVISRAITLECDFLYHTKASYFDCLHVQSHRPNMVVTTQILRRVMKEIVEENTKKKKQTQYISAREVFAKIRKAHPSMPAAVYEEFVRWLEIGDCGQQIFRGEDGELYLRLECDEKGK